MPRHGPEYKVKQAIRAVLERHKCYFHMPVVNGMGAPTLDFIVCHRGWFVGIEAKAPGKKPKPRQERTIREMESAGAVTFVIDGDPKELALLDRFLDTVPATNEEDAA